MKRHLLAVALGILLVSCGQSYEEERRLSRAESQRLRTADSLALKVAVMPTLDCLPLYVARERRLFDTLHVDVRLRAYSAQMDCDEALRAGSVEGMVTDRIRAGRLEAQGIVLEEVAATGAYWQLITNRKARIKDVKQLGDKMVAMTRHSATDYLTDRALEHTRLQAQVFKVQINDVNVRLQMLRNNEMDALWLTEPQATTARLEGNPVIKDSRKMGYRLGVMVFRADALKDARRRKQLGQLLKAYNTACDSLNHYGLQSYADVIRKYCQTDERTVRALPAMTFEKAATRR